MGEEEGCGLPVVEALREAFAWLDRASFPQQTGRLPLFAARHWSADLERRAFSRFRRGEDNVEEVAVPEETSPFRLLMLAVMSVAGVPM